MEKMVENFKFSQKFGISRQILDKYIPKRVKKPCQVLKLCHFKNKCLDVSMKLVK